MGRGGVLQKSVILMVEIFIYTYWHTVFQEAKVKYDFDIRIQENKYFVNLNSSQGQDVFFFFFPISFHCV